MAGSVKLVLAGEDTDVKVYGAESGRLVCQFRVFDEQPIHGIDVRQDAAGSATVLVWGSRYLAVFSVDDGMTESRCPPAFTKATSPDWIYDGRLSPFDPSVAVLATAHNEVVRVRIDREAGTVAVEDAVSPARPILYSAEMAWLEDNCVLMAAGTAFGEVLVWKCRFSREPEPHNTPSFHEMLFILRGHEGSIYGVHISPLLTPPGGADDSVRLLATCSDDRTIRIWDITERAENRRTYDKALFSAPRETGFSGMPQRNEEQQQPSMEATPPVAVAMGHLSRIWGVRITVPEGGGLMDDGGLSVYSFGEDSTAQRWHLSIDCPSETDGSAAVQLTGKLTHEKTFATHDGKHLWSHAMSLSSADKGKKMIMATGGADSRISLVQEPPSRLEVESDGLLTFEISDLCTADPVPQSHSRKTEALGRFDFISQEQLLVATTSGRLLIGTFSGDIPQWKRLQISADVEEQMRRLNVLKRAGHGKAVLGAIDGGVYFYAGRTEKLSHSVSLPGKVGHIICLNSDRREDDLPEPIDILVYTFGNANPQRLLLDQATGSLLSQEEVPGLDPRFVTTAASRIGEYLIMGSRHGYLSILRRVDNSSYAKVVDHAPHSRDAFTSIVSLPSTLTATPSGMKTVHFTTTSRDGHYRTYEMEDLNSRKPPQLRLRHESSLPFGPIVDGAWFTSGPSPELVLYGFRSKSFVVWNETQREELLSVDCGGGHRTFSLHHGKPDAEPLRVAFNRASRLSVLSQTSSPSRALKKGTHGREIRALSSNGRYIATGSEDTSVRILEYHRSSPSSSSSAPDGASPAMRCLASIKTHVTGIQTLKWLGEEYLFSSGGNEELFVFRLGRLDAGGYAGLGVVCEGVFDDKSPDGDLRIMDFDVQWEPRGHDGEHIVITMVFSSSALRTYRYIPGRGSFRLLARGAYTGACLTQVRHLGSGGGAAGSAVLTTSTDGHICLWQMTTQNTKEEQLYALAQAVPVHQSSIKCLHMISMKEEQEGTYCVVTGGDDNALGIVMLTSTPGPEDTAFAISSRGIVRRAHAAAVNGVIAYRQGGEDNITAVTVSNDQRIKTWAVTAGRDGAVGVELLGNVYSGVADPGDVDLLDGRGGTTSSVIMVGGVGVEVWISGG
ncbi:Regulator of Ty1 transposition protein-like protein [Hapsidospora chrysogenum ATCC 11550]|uniref:Regulator of Ty1 transposition protein-like protein n=1 Tax=Hapsidospora chrysogenum (strain ATCC 11550 / CBS 779.69 / DSM 880 / IAM 14645 / JCM 23072 / IMI 49137) TaxID=857340 RepID=A0A086T2B0_HAPC1|nr:Regulator of Ty1 transposition protein-like protein [Hapsidospora chrysogenum ATCC 11550]